MTSKVRPTSIMLDKESHRDYIISAYEKRTQALLDARESDREFIRCMSEARADGVKMNELAAWTGLSRQWLRVILNKDTTT